MLPNFTLTFINLALIFSDLGDLWSPAIPDNDQHLQSIENENKNLSDIRSFYIGGSAQQSSTSPKALSYSSYFKDNSGI